MKQHRVLLAPRGGPLGLVLTGGGARAAYQVGVLSWLGRRYPDLGLPIITGVSAGAINAVHLAAFQGSLPESVASLRTLWAGLTPERVFRVDPRSLLGHVAAWGGRLVSGGARGAPRVEGLVDTEPLRSFLERALPTRNGTIAGIDENLKRGSLRAVGVSTTSYTSGVSTLWMQGDVAPWTRPHRRAVPCRLAIDHVLASAALPIFFPAVRIGNDWYGDGGIRLAAPLSPALHLGARRILAISTRRRGRSQVAVGVDKQRYPAPAQVIGVLMTSIFLDLIDQDALRLKRLNRLLARVPEEERMGMEVVKLLVMRPSRDLGVLARGYEPSLPRTFRFLTRGLGTRETRSPDLLSMLMFQPDYVARLIEMGEEDAEARSEELAGFVEADDGALTSASGGSADCSPAASSSGCSR